MHHGPGALSVGCFRVISRPFVAACCSGWAHVLRRGYSTLVLNTRCGIKKRDVCCGVQLFVIDNEGEGEGRHWPLFRLAFARPMKKTSRRQQCVRPIVHHNRLDSRRDTSARGVCSGRIARWLIRRPSRVSKRHRPLLYEKREGPAEHFPNTNSNSGSTAWWCGSHHLVRTANAAEGGCGSYSSRSCLEHGIAD